MQAGDIIKLAAVKTGLAPNLNAIDTDIYAFALLALNRIYEDVWTIYPFRDEKMAGVSVSVTAGTANLILPIEVESIRSLRRTTETLYVTSGITISEFAPDLFSQTGTPSMFMNLSDSPLAVVWPTTGSAASIVSTSTADVTPLAVRIHGKVGGFEVFENIVLTGTTPAAGSSVFTEIISVSKPLTTGYISVKISTVEYARLNPWDYRSAYRRIKLVPSPTASETLYIEAVRKFPRITSDNDTILIARAEGAIIDHLCAELYEYDEKVELAALERQKGGERLKMAINREEQRDANDNVSYPAYGMFGDDGMQTGSQPTSLHYTY